MAAAQLSTVLTRWSAAQDERQRADALAELDRAKTEFFSNISHELRTPVTLVLGPVEAVLDRGAVDDDDRRALESVRRNGARLLKMVNSILELSRLDAGRTRAAYEPTDLSRFVASLASVFESAVEQAGLRLVVEAPPLARPVHVDREMWEHIVLNLLSNALKFTFEGTVTVRVRDGGAGAVVEVSDTGGGIPGDELPRLFQRFHRVRSSRSRSVEGTGIGLALVQELVGRHGGTVEVESEEGRGTTFRVTVPFGTAHLPAEEIAAAEGPRHGTAAATLYVGETQRWLAAEGVERADVRLGGAPPPGARRVLVVDDSGDLRDHLRRVLGPHFRVTTAVNGVEALRMATEELPDLVLSDVMMAGLDGYALTAALRADLRTRSLPIILLSARAESEAAEEALRVGADAYLLKPFSARELVMRLQATLDLAEVRAGIVRTLGRLNEAAIAMDGVQGTDAVAAVLARAAEQLVEGATARVDLSPPSADEGDPGAVVVALPAGRNLTARLELRVGARTLDETEEAALHQLSRLGGSRLESAGRYAAEHRIATTLQRSLLPHALPTIEGAVLAHRYVAGSADADVGGDWYDAVDLGAGRLAVVVGDVVGKGVEAAAAMGHLRIALRTLLIEGAGPGDALRRLNDVARRTEGTAFATVVCGVLDVAARSFRFASAGHPPPVVSTGGGVASAAHVGGLGTMIGVDPDASYREVEVDLSAGGRVVLYTDGLVESRELPVSEGIDALERFVAGHRGRAGELVDALVDAAPGGHRRDDVAVLVVELLGVAP